MKRGRAKRKGSQADMVRRRIKTQTRELEGSKAREKGVRAIPKKKGREREREA